MNEALFGLNLEVALLMLCDVALDHYSPCQIKDGGCLRGNPIPCCQGRIWNLEWRKEHGGCKFLLPGDDLSGQLVCSNPNLKCKSWICKDALETIHPDCLDILQKVEAIGKKHGLIGRPYLGEAHTKD